MTHRLQHLSLRCGRWELELEHSRVSLHHHLSDKRLLLPGYHFTGLVLLYAFKVFRFSKTHLGATFHFMRGVARMVGKS